jgi:hypothetical protein
VCVQPLLVYRAREGEDLTRDKSDPKDAVPIARLASKLRCYEPERADAVWARLRRLRARRGQLPTAATAAVNQIRDLAECAWPTVLAAAGSPFRSVTWCASLAVVLDRCAGKPATRPVVKKERKASAGPQISSTVPSPRPNPVISGACRATGTSVMSRNSRTVSASRSLRIPAKATESTVTGYSFGPLLVLPLPPGRCG